MTYREIWRVPVWWAVIGLGVGLGAAAEVHQGAGGLRAVLPYVLIPLVVLGALLYLSRQRVLVQYGVLHVPGARAPLDAFDAPETLDRDGLRLYLGPAAKRHAWVVVKPWHHAAVLLAVNDPEDQTPYWLVGTRHPEALAAAVRTSP